VLCAVLDRKLRVCSELKERQGSKSKRMLQLTLLNASNMGLKYTKTPPFDTFAMLYRLLLRNSARDSLDQRNKVKIGELEVGCPTPKVPPLDRGVTRTRIMGFPRAENPGIILEICLR
jgi:hypothetical protein